MKYVSRPGADDEKAIAGAVGTDPAFERDYPAIWEYLTLTRWDDGRARETSTILFLVEEGTWKACLNDRAGERSLWTSGTSPEGCLRALNDHLVEGDGEWRKRPPQQRSKKR